MPITVVIADDHPLQREGYRMVLESQPDFVSVLEAGDGARVLALVRKQLTDVVLMDIQMPRVNGLVAADRIMNDARVLELGPAPRIVLVTAVDLDDHVDAAAAAGAVAVLYKDVRPEALLEVLRAAAAGAPTAD